MRIAPRNRETAPSVRQRNTAESETLAWNTSVVDAWIVQALGGATPVEIADASQEGKIRQSGVAEAVASQVEPVNYSLWIGVEPPPDPVAGDEPVAPVATKAPVLAPSGTFFRTNVPAKKASPHRSTRHTATASKRPHKRHIQLPLVGSLPSVGSLPMLGSGPVAAPAPGAKPSVTVPGSGATAPYAFPSPFAAPSAFAAPSDTAHSSSKSSSSSSKPSKVAAQPRAEQHPFVPLPLAPYNWASFGASGFAPLSGGSGPLAAAPRPFKFAAPAHIGPQVPTLTLGRSAAFLEPFERPG